MMMPAAPELIATTLFGIAIVHTFSTKHFMQLANRYPRHAGMFHLLGEVEVVFGLWAGVLIVMLLVTSGKEATLSYLNQRSFIEPLFVFVIMVISGTRSVLQTVVVLVRQTSKVLPISSTLSIYFLLIFLVPLLGSLITEPAAMTLAALVLRDVYFSKGLSVRLKYATLGVLFVNVSIGGTLTTFAAPPVLMVASTWQWDNVYMLSNFGWKAIIATAVNAGTVTYAFRHELIAKIKPSLDHTGDRQVSAGVKAIHLLFLLGVVIFAHHPLMFIGLLLLFVGFAAAYPQHQDRLILRESFLVAFFLAGLVVLGGLQQWWLQPALQDVDNTVLFFVAVGLTAIVDNAALTYLGSLVEGTDAAFRYALVAGAVAGGGLTVIANAPNPAGLAILKSAFENETISPLGLLLAALLPTMVAIAAFIVL